MDRVESVIDALHRLYGVILRWALDQRIAVLVIALVTFVGSFFIVPLVGTEFIPRPTRASSRCASIRP
jgi:HAE1 family hydrophobic/amphiphilic exporter-1